jgi:hypothetical protein
VSNDLGLVLEHLNRDCLINKNEIEPESFIHHTEGRRTIMEIKLTQLSSCAG